MRLNFTISQYFAREPFKPAELAEFYQGLTKQLDKLLGTQKQWFLQGYSRKQALQHQVFTAEGISETVLARWQKEYQRESKKPYPFWSAGIWDGEADEVSSGIDLYPSYSEDKKYGGKRQRLNLGFSIDPEQKVITVDAMLEFVTYLLRVHPQCVYLNVETQSYNFGKLIEEPNEFGIEYTHLFPDRILCGWMIFVPDAVLTAEQFPDAAKVAPVMLNGQQLGTIIVSTEEMFDGENLAHIHQSNQVESKLHQLGLLPLRREL